MLKTGVQNKYKSLHGYYITAPKRRLFQNIFFLFVIVVICLNYFEIYYHFWFLKLFSGYVMKIWSLPVFLFSYLLTKQFVSGRVIFPARNIKHLNGIIIFYVLFGFGSLVVHEQLWNIGKFSLIMFAPLLFYVSIIYLFRDNNEIERVLKVIFFLGLFFALYSTYLFVVIGHEAWKDASIEKKFIASGAENIVSDYHGYSQFSKEYGKTVKRRSVPGLDETKYGIMLTPLVILGLVYATNSKSYLRVFYYASSMGLFYTVMLTLSRSVTVASFVGVILFLFHLRNKLLSIVFCFITISMLIYIATVTEGAIDRLIQLFQSMPILGQTEFISGLAENRGIYYRQDGHVESYYSVVNILKEAPLFGILGIGMGKFYDMFKLYSWGIPHSRYMVLLCTAGFLTLISYVVFIVALIATARKKLLSIRVQSQARDLGLVLYPSIISFAIKLNNEGMETYYYWIFFGLTAAWIRNLTREVQK